jgi:hypothetical protein
MFLLYFLLFFYVAIVIIVAVVFALVASSEQAKSKPQYGVKSVTLNGEEVKSIGEQRIADYFRRNKIRYVYEKELRKKSLFTHYRISRPDFYLPDYDVYVEYWGLVDADDNYTRKQYVKNMKRKMAIYYKNNVRFISIYPRNMDNLDWIFRKKFEKITGHQLHN